MGLLDAFAGALSGGAQFMADDIQKQIALERQQALEESRMAAQEAMNIRAEDRLAARQEKDPLRKAQIEGAELQNSELKRKQAVGLINQGVDTQLPDGSFVAVGSDGKARRVGQDGTPIDLKGVDASTYGMDAKEKLQLKAADLQVKALQTSRAEAGVKKAEAVALKTSLSNYLTAQQTLEENPNDKAAQAAFKTARNGYYLALGKLPESSQGKITKIGE